jgi:hypothetical protein
MFSPPSDSRGVALPDVDAGRRKAGRDVVEERSEPDAKDTLE